MVVVVKKKKNPARSGEDARYLLVYRKKVLTVMKINKEKNINRWKGKPASLNP